MVSAFIFIDAHGLFDERTTRRHWDIELVSFQMVLRPDMEVLEVFLYCP